MTLLSIVGHFEKDPVLLVQQELFIFEKKYQSSTNLVSGEIISPDRENVAIVLAIFRAKSNVNGLGSI